MRILFGAVLTLLVVIAFGCSKRDIGFPLPQPASPPPQSTGDGLRVGFGRSDITPAPGFPLAGNALEGEQATGYRHRLYARAMVLEDGRGERFALLTADLGHVSANLHRLTAERIQSTTGIGADRLLVSVTHTHSGPGSHYAVRSYNDQSAAFPGYDPMMVEFLVARFSQSVLVAFEDLKPAMAAWDTVIVPAPEGLTRNRSYDAFLHNPEPRLTRTTPRRSDETDHDARERQRLEAVDRVWRMLRIDQCNAARTQCQAKGAFSVYAIHGTGNPSANPLIDADIHAIVERGLERHIESLPGSDMPSSVPRNCSTRNENDPISATPDGCTFASPAFHLFANGTEGDVSPNHDPGTRCGPEEVDKTVAGGDAGLEFRVARRPGGPRTPRPPEEWRRSRFRSADDCLERAKASISRLGEALTNHAVRAFTRAGTHLSADLEIRRAFVSHDLQDDFGDPSVCSAPRTGTANFAGAEDGRTRMYKWRFLFLFPAGLEEGNSAVNQRDNGCFGAKLIALGPLQGLIIGRGGLPRFAQLSVVQIGNGLLGSVPAEVTTEAGMRMKAAMRSASPPDVEYVGIVGLANGYMQYITTAEEYTVQSYEGGSNLYGPNTAAALTNELQTLTASLTTSPIVHVGPITATPWTASRVLYPRSDGPRITDIERTVESVTCVDGTLEAVWIDGYPGLFVPADGPVIEIQKQQRPGAWQPVVWDDDRAVEIQAWGPRGSGYGWRATWSPQTLENGVYRMVLFERSIPGEGTFESVPLPGHPVPSTTCG